MSTSISWPPIGGTSYSVPASGETNWPSLSSFLIALAAAQTTTAQKVGVRIATTSPVTVVSATDCVVVTNLGVAGPVAVNLPAGVAGQEFVIIDGKGDAATNNITITPNGAETINGAATFVIRGNRSGVAIAFTGSGNWTVLTQSGGASINVDYIDFNTGVANPSYLEGRLFYDNTNDTLSFYNAEADVKLDIGEENWIKVRNSTGSTILDGQAVYINGATGQNPTIALAQANTAPGSRTIGIATHDIENNTIGYVTVFGLVRDLDTSAFSDGAILYLSASVAGGLTITAPTAPNYSINVGIVAHSHVTQGKILVDPDKTLGLGLGTANQVLGINNGATGQEYKSVLGTTDEIIVTHGTNSITIDADATSAGTANKLVKRDATGGSAFDYVDHDGQGSAPTYVAGRMWYDTVDNTMRYFNDSATDSVNIGQEINVKVRNNSGSTMNPGQVVRITGAIGGVPTVSLAQSNAFATSRVFAVITETLANNTNGYATVSGLIKNLNLSAFADGDLLYLSSSVAGGLTATRPSSPNYVMPVGSVSSNNASTGRLIVQLGLLRALGFGTSNQLLGMNSGGTEQEYKTFAEGLVPLAVSANVSPAVVSRMYSCTSSGGFTITLPTIPAAGGVIGIMDGGETCSATNFIRVTPATGQSIDGYVANDSLVIDYVRANIALYAAAGATSWKVQYQATSMVQGGQVPGSSGATATAAGFIGESPFAYYLPTFTNVPTTYWDVTSWAPSSTGIYRVSIQIYHFKNAATYSTDPDLAAGISTTIGNSVTGLAATATMSNPTLAAASFNYFETTFTRTVRFTGTAFILPDGTTLTGTTLYFKGRHAGASSGNPQYRAYVEVTRAG